MSCFCYICKNSNQIETHEEFVKSDFTLQNCVVNLYISGYSVSLPNSYLGFRLNRFLAIVPSDSSVTFHTWTIEDCLFVEIHGESAVLGLGKIYLSRCGFNGPQEITDIEWYTDITASVRVDLNFTSFPRQDPNAVAIYRKSFFAEDSEKYSLLVKFAGAESEHKLKDQLLGFKEEVWQQLGVCEKNTEVECVLKSETANSSLILSTSSPYPIHSNIPTPGFTGSFVNLYTVPFFSQFLSTPSTTLQFQLRPSSNFWFASLSEPSVLTISLKSSITVEGNISEFSTNISEIGEILEYQFMTFASEDKIIIKIVEENKATSIGILKLKELSGLELGKAYETNVQMGYNSCQIWITVAPREKNQQEVRISQHDEFIEKVPAKLTYKDPIFLDVLELLEYKINRISKKNTLVNTQVNKIVTRNEVLKKTISELERAPSITDFKAPAQKNKIKTEAVKREMFEGICGCGRPNPKFKGYCEVCVKELKGTYEKVFNWFSPIESKHKGLEDRYVNFSTRKMLLEGKIKKLEDKISKPIDLDGGDLETAAELAANLRKLEEEINGLETETENTAALYSKQQQEYLAEINKNQKEKEVQAKVIEKNLESVGAINTQIGDAKESLVFQQYFNDKYANKK